jgi:hypothetical protein
VRVWGKNRRFNRIGALAFLGLAVCVFAWGLQYKLSLYGQPQSSGNQIPHAKLLSKNEQSETTQEIRTRTSTKVIYAVPAIILLVLLLIPRVLNHLLSEFRAQMENQWWRLHARAVLSGLFVRPPPVLG